MTNKPPAHYPEGTYEPWNVIEAWGLGYELGNVLKYIARAGKKGPALDDLVKARNYLDRKIDLESAKVLNGNTLTVSNSGPETVTQWLNAPNPPAHFSIPRMGISCGCDECVRNPIGVPCK